MQSNIGCVISFLSTLPCSLVSLHYSAEHSVISASFFYNHASGSRAAKVGRSTPTSVQYAYNYFYAICTLLIQCICRILQQFKDPSSFIQSSKRNNCEAVARPSDDTYSMLFIHFEILEPSESRRQWMRACRSTWIPSRTASTVLVRSTPS
jgi:hypothetical protein